jgi:hypothetical protein
MKLENFKYENSKIEILVKCDKVELEVFYENFEGKNFYIGKQTKNFEFLEKLNSIIVEKNKIEIIDKRYVKLIFNVSNCPSDAKVNKVGISINSVEMEIS